MKFVIGTFSKPLTGVPPESSPRTSPTIQWKHMSSVLRTQKGSYNTDVMRDYIKWLNDNEIVYTVEAECFDEVWELSPVIKLRKRQYAVVIPNIAAATLFRFRFPNLNMA